MTTLYAALISLVYLGLFFLRFQDLSATAWLGIGFLIGLVMLEIDQRVAHYWYNEGQEKFLITRSPFFLIVYLPLAIYVLTSSGSLIGSGLILGMGGVIWIEMLLRFQQPIEFKKRFLSNIAVPIPDENIQKMFVVASGALLFLASILLW